MIRCLLLFRSWNYRHMSSSNLALTVLQVPQFLGLAIWCKARIGVHLQSWVDSLAGLTCEKLTRGSAASDASTPF